MRYDNIITLHIFIMLIIGVSRLLIPTELDWSVTSVYKDFVHIYIGIVLLHCWQIGSKLLWFSVLTLTIWEVLAAVLLK